MDKGLFEEKENGIGEQKMVNDFLRVFSHILLGYLIGMLIRKLDGENGK